jgi:DNA-binding LacI/PurR family transcriptional regulator
MYFAKQAGQRGRVDYKEPSLRSPSSNVVLNALYELISRLDDGARLPTVRELMKNFRVSQATVQDAIARLRDEGLLTSQVGRGTYVVKAGTSDSGRAEPHQRTAPHLDSLLILSNASMNERCALVQNYIMEEMARSDSKVVQMSYHHTGHLLEILSSIPSFDAAILQSHYENIPIRLLHLLQEKTHALVVDGHTVSGVDVDRIGTDWEEALDMALQHLSALGHRAIGLVSLNTMAQPILSARRAFARLGQRLQNGFELFQPILLKGVLHPTHRVDNALEDALTPLFDESGRLPFTAMITLGISDTLGIRQCLDRLGLQYPKDVSVFVLGHHDVPTEHLGVMTVAGSSHLEAAQQLVQAIGRRLAAPHLPPQIVYLNCNQTIRDSTGKAQSA